MSGERLREAIMALPTWDKRSVPGGVHVKRADVLILVDIAAAAAEPPALFMGDEPDPAAVAELHRRLADEPPALDVERLRRALINIDLSNPADWLDEGDETDAVIAEYARLAREGSDGA